nr:glycosyltransferase family 2 protein [Heyndrickxia coagulans]
MYKPLVSVIVPVFNVEKYLHRCLTSIVNQTYRNIEILVVNDGSTDNSLNIIYQFKELDDRISVIEKENGGQASARNIALDISKGEYILMVDSDDYIINNLIEDCIKIANEQACDLIVFDYFNINNQGNKEYVNKGVGLSTSGSIPWNKFYKKHLWKYERFPTGYWYEDLGTIPIIVANAQKIIKINKAYYFYETFRNNSQTNSLDVEKVFDIIAMLERVYKKLSQDKKLQENFEEIENLYIEHLIYITILTRYTCIADKNIRKKLLNDIKLVMESRFPNWRNSKYVKNKTVANRIKRYAINWYLNDHRFIGNLLWYYPKKLKTKIMGF